MSGRLHYGDIVLSSITFSFHSLFLFCKSDHGRLFLGYLIINRNYLKEKTTSFLGALSPSDESRSVSRVLRKNGCPSFLGTVKAQNTVRLDKNLAHYAGKANFTGNSATQRADVDLRMTTCMPAENSEVNFEEPSHQFPYTLVSYEN